MTRADIGQELETSVDGVKLLLREGRFFADPTTSPDRKALADRAAQARSHGTTQARFRTDLGLSIVRAKQAWRDAAILHGDPSETGVSAP